MSSPNTLPDSALLSQLYDAAMDPSQWPAFLSMLGTRLNSHAGMLWSHDFADRKAEPGLVDGSDVLSVTHGFDQSYLDSFFVHYCQHNVWLEDERKHKAGLVVNGSMLFPPDQLCRTEFWTDWLRPQDIFHTAAAIVDKDSRSTNVTLVRNQQAGEYTEAELDILRALMPHLKSAIALHRRLHALKQSALSANAVLDALPFGVILLGRALEVLFIAQKAAALAASTALLRLREGQPIDCLSSSSSGDLRRPLHEAARTGLSADGAAGGSVRLVNSAGQRVNVVVTPLPTWSEPFSMPACVAVFISSPEAAVCELSSVLQQIYRMTPAEARLSESLANGSSLQEYADEHLVSINTCRTQLKAALAKTETRRQAELVRLVLTGPAVLQWHAAQAVSLEASSRLA